MILELGRESLLCKLSQENVVLFICQVWANVRHLLPIKISILENHSLRPYFGFVSSSTLSTLLFFFALNQF